MFDKATKDAQLVDRDWEHLGDQSRLYPGAIAAWSCHNGRADGDS